MSGKLVSTIGFERRYNTALQPRSPREFREFILTSLPTQPANFAAIRHQNFHGGSGGD